MKGITRAGESDDASDLERKAAAWVGRRDAGLGPVAAKELQAWLAADPRHAAVYARLESAARALDRLRAFRPAAGGLPDPDLPLVGAPRRLARIRIMATMTALAATLAVALLLPWRHVRVPAVQAAYSTSIGSLRLVDLPDGSRLTLNTDSVVNVAFAAERWVELIRGEVHFAVAPEAGRPFVVQAGAVRVRAVGTAFSVRLRNEAVEVLVTEGRVGVLERERDQTLLPAAAPQNAPPLLVAGQRATIAVARKTASGAPRTIVADVTPVEIAQTLAWQEKRLEFGPLPLRDVVAEFNRYSEVQLVVDDPATATISVGGSFHAGDWQTLVRLLESNFEVEVSRRGGEVVLRRR